MNTTRKLTVLVAACVAACMVAACGSSTSSSSSSSSSAASGGTTAATAVRSKFVSCMKAHGVTVRGFRGRPGGGAGGGGAPPSGSGTAGGGGAPPPGGFRGGGFGGGGGFGQGFRSNPKLQAAFKACAADLPKGASRLRRFGARPQRAAITQFVTCVRKHGYNLPAPNLSGKGPVFPSKIESNAKFQAASRACRNLLVPQGAGSGTASSSA